jgi:hypothetical protein
MKNSYSEAGAPAPKKGSPSDASAYKSEGGMMKEKSRNSSLDKQGSVGSKDESAYKSAGIQDQKKQAGA